MKIFKLIIQIFVALLTVAMTGCKSEEPITEHGNEENVLELPRINCFHDIAATGHGAWVVSEFPEWAAPMEDNGNDGDSVKLFVETNTDDEDRTAALKISFADGVEAVYSLIQHGALSDSENGTVLSAKDLKETYGVGYSTNVFLSSTTEKYFVNAMTPINFRKLKKALDGAGESDAMVDEDRYYSRIETVTGSSTSAVANQLSINAGIEVGISAFKIGVEGGYSSDKNENNKYEYAMEEIQHIVGTRQLRPGMLRYLADSGTDVFQSSFVKLRDALAKNPNDQAAMDEILTLYGTHIITQGSLGGELKLSMQMKVTDELSASDIHAALDLGTKVVNVKGEFNMNNKEKAISSNTTISLVTYGGENIYTIAPGATFESFQKNVKDPAKLDRWVSKIKDNESLALIDMEVYPIYELMPTDAAREALRNYIVGPYQIKMYSDKNNKYPGPDLYVLKGFNLDNNLEQECTVYIPEIDMEIKACHTYMPELSLTESSTVIYSGTKGKVNKDRGFFVGSATRKPCKFKRERNGKLTIEEFDRLNSESITELYVDATGDITIFPKSAADLYRTVEFSDWKLIDGKYTTTSLGESYNISISKPTILTGSTLFYTTVTIKPDVPVILKDVKLNGVIKCEGNAIVIIPEGSSVSIYQSTNGNEADCPAIGVGPKGSNLVIDGFGKLRASARAAAVGSHGAGNVCGNIIINGGNLTFEGYDGPAIGSSRGSVCGNVSIKGGVVNASSHGGVYNAAIGTSNDSECGNIFISRNIGSLTVYKTYAALEHIGRGSSSAKCGKVVIEDESKVVYQ